MKKIYLSILAIVCLGMSLHAQSISLEELKAKKADLAAKAGEAQAQADALNGEISGLQKEIDILSGWTRGLAGTVGADFNQSNNWISAPNPNAASTGLGIGLSAFANKLTEKTLWRNKGILNKAWQDVDQDLPGEVDDNLFDNENGVIDLLNLSSLYGYRIHPKFAITALGELNTSIGNFLKPGAADIGVGGTWTPSNNLVVVIHPLNYHIAWPADGTGVESTGALGAKLRADYTNSYNLLGKQVGLSSTFTAFLPYSDKQSTFFAGTDNEYNAGLTEYTWINTLSFTVWKGIGVGVGFGFRSADFEINETLQNYYNVGLSYNI